MLRYSKNFFEKEVAHLNYITNFLDYTQVQKKNSNSSIIFPAILQSLDVEVVAM